MIGAQYYDATLAQSNAYTVRGGSLWSLHMHAVSAYWR